ncbi:MAG: single-stranded DNA-binding protein [Candidatus Daviesbacteria bacterium]|nr:single-stranded DNA-binding protein [Candidatus Daviesbacteria bacterium]
MASRSWNRVELIGNLTRDPELRYTPNGAAVVTFGMATNRTYVTEGERKEEADFHKLVAWNKLAELCNQLLKKGMRVFISGRLQTRSWTAQDGTQRQSTEIVVEDMIILTPKNFGETAATPEDAEAEHAKTEETEPEEKVTVKEKIEDEAKSAKKETEVSQEETPPQEEVKDDLPF